MDADTACHVVAIVDNGNARETVAALAPIGAPFAFLAGPRRVEMWPVPSPDDRTQEAFALLNSSYRDLPRKLGRHHRDLNPDAIIRAKRRAVQLSLWHGVPEFYEYAIRINERTFTREVVNAIAAAVLGGTSLAGGRGTIGGTIVGAFVIGVLGDGLVMMGVSQFWQMVIKGVVIIAAVVLDQMQRKMTR